MKAGIEGLFLQAKAAERDRNPAKAAAIYRGILQQRPRNAKAQRGLARLETAGATQGAAGAPIAREEFDALVRLYQQGQFEAVALKAHELVARAPTALPLLVMLGAAQSKLRRFEAATATFRRAIAVKPDNADAHFNLGNVLMEQDKLEDAAAAFRQAAELKPDSADIHNNLGIALKKLGLWQEAIASFRRVIAIRPDYARAYFNLGNALMEQGDLDEAAAIQQRATILRPDYVEAYVNLCHIFRKQERMEDALAASHKALAINPDFAVAHNALGTVLKDLGKLDEAATAIRYAIAIKPDYVEGLISLGLVLTEQSKFDEAVSIFRQALMHMPGSIDAHYDLALLHLLRGEYEQGWRLYEIRKAKDNIRSGRPLVKPLWLGDQNVRGKTVFVHHEQGLGDTIQFIRYVGLVKDRGAKVILSVQQALLPLLTNALGDVEVIGGDDEPADFDYHVPLLSLPLVFGTDLATIPNQTPYLVAEAARVERWRQRLGASGFKIGICWQGSKGPVDTGRSFPLSLFSEIADLPGVRLISLHKGAGEAQLEELGKRLRIEVPGPDFDAKDGAFLDTAAVMTTCDLVITSDTAVAHLAGALSVPVWTMLKHVPDWRWLTDRSDSPWYPSMRLFRQPAPGDWDGAFRIAAEHLRQLMLQHPSYQAGSL